MAAGLLELARAYVTVRADNSRLAGDMGGMRSMIEQQVGGMGASISGMVGRLGLVMGAGAFATVGVRAAAEAEQMQIAFATMLGSAEEAAKTMEKLTQFAALTPFEMPEITQAARGLIQFGERGEDLMETLELLGNAASATSTQFGMVALIFNQIRGVGKLLTQDFRQLSTRGILSLQDLAKHFKVSTQEAQQMLSKGKVSFEDVRDIFKMLSGEGGRFANMMERQSQSASGLLSTLKDNFNLFARAVMETVMPALSELMRAANLVLGTLKEALNKDVIKIVLELAGAFMAIKAAIWLAQKAMVAFGTAAKVAAAAQAFVMGLAGPTGWRQLAIAVGASTVAIGTMGFVLSQVEGSGSKAAMGVNEATDATKELAETINEAKIKAEQLAKTLEQFGIPAYHKGIKQFSVETQIALGKLEQRIRAAQEGLARGFVGPLGGKPQRGAQSFGFEMEGIQAVLREFGGNMETLTEFINDQLGNLQTPEEKISRYQNQLMLLQRLGLIKAEQAQKLFNQALADSPLGEAGKRIESLRQQVFEYTMGFHEEANRVKKEMRDFSQLPGVTPAMITSFQHFRMQLDDLQKKARFKDIGKQLAESLATPTEQARREFDQLKQVMASGLDPEVARRALKRMQAEIEPNVLGEIRGQIGFAEFGRQIQDAFLRREDPAVKTAANTAAANQLLKEIKAELGKLNQPEKALVLSPP